MAARLVLGADKDGRGLCSTRGLERDSWRGGALTWRVICPRPKADPWIPKGRRATGQLGQKLQKKKVKSRESQNMRNRKKWKWMGLYLTQRVWNPKPQKKSASCGTEETQDYGRETLAISQEEAEEMGFVPSALGEPRGTIYWCDKRCSEKAIRYWQIAQCLRKVVKPAQSFCVSSATMKSGYSKAYSHWNCGNGKV